MIVSNRRYVDLYSHTAANLKRKEQQFAYFTGLPVCFNSHFDRLIDTSVSYVREGG